MYFSTDEASGGAPILNAGGFPSNASYGQAVLKVVNDPSTTSSSQNVNGWGMRVADYFIPYNVAALDNADSDVGSGGVLVLPDSAGTPGHPHLLIAGGDQGKLYVIDRDNMGHFDANNDHVLNAVPDGSGHTTPPVQLNGLECTPAFYHGAIYAVAGFGGAATSFQIALSGTLNQTSTSAVASFGFGPGAPAVSANGNASGIVWLTDRNTNALHAYDATTFATELWNSNQRGGGLDSVGALPPFTAPPTIAGGQVYVGTSNSLVMFGLLPGG
jgi:hypothetical protein